MRVSIILTMYLAANLAHAGGGNNRRRNGTSWSYGS